jgi:8-oxo-dGTP pyrophosphatase MutT (NUDIX family)
MSSRPEVLRTRLEALGARVPFVLPDHEVPATFRESAVLIAFWQVRRKTFTALIRRASTLSTHAGQIAFPGGGLDPGESAEQAAVREAYEEIGLDPGIVRVVGRLDDAWSGAGHRVVPVVAWLSERPELEASPAEVDEILLAHYDEMTAPGALASHVIQHRGGAYTNRTVSFSAGQAVGFTADLLLEALDWLRGHDPERGVERLNELRAWLKGAASEDLDEDD